MSLVGGNNLIGELITRKKYPKAVKILKAELAQRPDNQHVRLQLADVLVLSGRAEEAAPILSALADDYARDGFSAKAIAVLKKLERVAPGRSDVEHRLAELITLPTEPQPPAPLKLRVGGRVAEALRAAEDEERQAASRKAEPGPPAVAARAEAGPPAASADNSKPSADTPAPEAYLRIGNEVIELDLDLLEHDEQPDLFANPLFAGFSREELLEVIRGLRSVTFEPGDVIVSEGEAGGSLFVVSSGAVKAFVRDEGGHAHKVREMAQGSFFGEIALLGGGLRTATVTAASTCELLELDRPTLARIVAKHPHVEAVLTDFYYQRLGGRPDGESAASPKPKA